MRRVLVIGAGGAGKSTFASRLSMRTGLPAVHLDALYWRPGWVEPPAAEWAETVAGVLAGEAWIIDGNYGGTLDRRLAACDTVVFLDRGRLVCLWRVLRRWLRFRGRSRPDMAADCPERLSLEFLRWIWTYPRERRPAILARLDALAPDKRVVILRTAAEIEEFLEGQSAA